MTSFSQRIHAVAPSRTTRFTGLIGRLRAQGRDIIDLAVGEYYRPPEPAVIEATRTALAEHRTGYGPVAGLPQLRARLAAAHGLGGPERAIVSNGAKQILYGLFQVLLNPGDEVIIPAPCWVSFPEMVRLAGGHPRLVETNEGRLDPEAVAAAVTPKTRAILINTPNNPTGVVYPKTDVAAMAKTAAARGIFLIGDETYGRLVYDGLQPFSVLSLADAGDHAVAVGSFSKMHSMTGFRVGFAVGPEPVIRALEKWQSHASGNVCTFAQHGALAALDLPENVLDARVAELGASRDLARAALRGRFPHSRSQGGFYLLIDISARLASGETSETVAMALLDRAGVAVVPGEAFGASHAIRLSFAVPSKQLAEGLNRMMETL